LPADKRERETRTVASNRPAVRCAIYTRKSTDEGLDQAFNTLDAQREAAEAFVDSQRHEGWTALTQKYDDGGIGRGCSDCWVLSNRETRTAW
jgi:site-specific DNA recombinase